MDSKLQTAWKLYNKAKREVFDDKFPDPVVWVYNKEPKKTWMQATSGESEFPLVFIGGTPIDRSLFGWYGISRAKGYQRYLPRVTKSPWNV
eukprot:6013716-Karenia_brevis.AAC.1